MAKEVKKKEPPIVKYEGPVRFHRLSDEERQEVLIRLAKGEVELKGPDHQVVEVK